MVANLKFKNSNHKLLYKGVKTKRLLELVLQTSSLVFFTSQGFVTLLILIYSMNASLCEESTEVVSSGSGTSSGIFKSSHF